MKTIRWGMIGAGDVTEVKSGPALQKANHSELVAVMRRNGDLAQDYAQRHGVPRWYDDADVLINDPQVDAVYIATPPHVHKDYTLKVAAAGKPIYCEKPMALTFAECEAMIAACKDAGVPLWIAYYRRMLPRFIKIKELVETGAIGDIRTVIVTLHQKPRLLRDDEGKLPWRVLPEMSGGGILIDAGSHTLDFLDYILGPIASVSGTATNQRGDYSAEDNVVGSFIFESGVTGVGSWCFTAHADRDQTEIIGSQGKISFTTFRPLPIIVETTDGIQEFAIDDPPHVHQPLIQTIVDQFNGVGICPSTGESGARTNWVIDQLLDTYRSTQ